MDKDIFSKIDLEIVIYTCNIMEIGRWLDDSDEIFDCDNKLVSTGFIDCYDLFAERIEEERYLHGQDWKAVVSREELIKVKGAEDRKIEVKTTHHGVLLEPLMQQLGMSNIVEPNLNQTSLYWSLRDVPTSAGALALLPMAKTTSEFGDFLFEDGVCPLVNNIICIDQQNKIERYIASVVPVRVGVTGSVPMAGLSLIHI